MDRRNFHKLCGGLLGYAAGGAAGLPSLVAASTPYQPTQLLFEDDSPVTLDSLQTGDAFIFSYPYRTTPCFLVKLSTSAMAAGPGQVVSMKILPWSRTRLSAVTRCHTRPNQSAIFPIGMNP